jgi:hypothetical protein
MRLLVLLSLAVFVALLVPFGLFTASDAECPAQGTAASNVRLVPFSAEEFAAFRARHRGHIVFDELFNQRTK